MINFDLIENFVKDKHKIHDFAAYDHVKRVYDLCMLMAEEYETVDLDILRASAYLHDIAVPVFGPEEHHENVKHVVGNLLLKAGFTPEQQDQVFEVIKAHTRYYDVEPSSLEAMILRDADGIDYVGAVGIMRGVVRAYKKGSYNGNVTKQGLEVLNELISTVENTFSTSIGKKIATEKIDIVKSFINTLQGELGLS